MALDDFRKLIDIDDVGQAGETGQAPFLAVEVTDGDRPILLSVSMGGLTVAVPMDYGTAGTLFDALAGAMRTVVGRQATAKLDPADTPPAETSVPVSDGSGTL